MAANKEEDRKRKTNQRNWCRQINQSKLSAVAVASRAHSKLYKRDDHQSAKHESFGILFFLVVPLNHSRNVLKEEGLRELRGGIGFDCLHNIPRVSLGSES